MAHPMLTAAIDRLAPRPDLPADDASPVLRGGVEGRPSHAATPAFLVPMRTTGGGAARRGRGRAGRGTQRRGPYLDWRPDAEPDAHSRDRPARRAPGPAGRRGLRGAARGDGGPLL